MILRIGPISVLLTIIIVLLNVIYYSCKFKIQKNTKRSVKIVQLLVILNMLIQLICLYFSLIRSYQGKLWYFDSNTDFLILKKFHFILEVIFKSCLFFALKVFFNEMSYVMTIDFIEHKNKEKSILLYSLLRFVVGGFIFETVNNDYAIFAMLSEAFFIGESLSIVIIALHLMYLISCFEDQIIDKILVDAFIIDNTFASWILSLKFLICSMVLEIGYRIMFLKLASIDINVYNTTLTEIASFIKVIAISLQLYSLSTILFSNNLFKEDEFKNARKILNNDKYFSSKDNNVEFHENSSYISISEFNHMLNHTSNLPINK